MNMAWQIVEIWPKVGLAKNALSRDGAMCALGVANYVTHGTPYGVNAHWSSSQESDRLDVLREMSWVAVEQFPERTDRGNIVVANLVDVNNHPDTTLLDMVTIAEKAAVRLDERV